MSIIFETIRIEDDNTISFGNYLVDTKIKIENFLHNGDIYTLKTFSEVTRLKKNNILLFESVPGCTVHNFYMDNKIVSFNIEGLSNAQITMELESQKDYKIFIDDVNLGSTNSKISGKINFSLDLKNSTQNVKIQKINK